MAAHKYWRIRVIKDSNFYSGGNYYLNVKEMGFYDSAMTRLSPVNVYANNYFGAYPPANAFDNNTSTLLSLDTNIIRQQGYAWVRAEFATAVDAVFFKYLPDSNNCPLDFAIDWSDDNIVWKESIRHTMGQVTTESVFPTGQKIAQSMAGAYPMWRIRMTVDTGSMANSRHYQNFKSLRFIDGTGAVKLPLAAFSSAYDGVVGTPTAAFAGGATGIITDGLYVTPKTNCFIGMAVGTAFRPSKVQFIMQTGQGIQASNASFVIEGSTNGKTWFQEAEYINQPFSIDTLMDFAVPGALNSDMTMKKLSELPYTDLTAAQAKDALVPLSGIGDEVDTLYKVTLADLAAMIVNSSSVGTDYHKEHRGWRIMFGKTLGTGNEFSAIGDLVFLDRAGAVVPTTGGYPYSYNGDPTQTQYGPANAFDGDPASFASSYVKDGGYVAANNNYGVGYVFANPVDVGSIKITPATGFVGDAPKHFAVQYSDDGGISWTSFMSYENITDWATGISKQFYLPNAGVSTSGINYGKDFWRSVSFSTPATFFNIASVFPSQVIISGAAPGRRLVIEALIKKAVDGDIFMAVGDVSGQKAYGLAAQSDGNLVSYYYQSTGMTAFAATGGNNALYDYSGFYHLKLEINIADVASSYHAMTMWINGMNINLSPNKPFVIDSAVNLAQDLKIFIRAASAENIQWCHYRWDDNGLDIPVISGSTGGGDNGGDNGGGETVVVGGSPTRYYRLGGFATVSPQPNEVLVLNAVADPFVFGADFVGSSGKAGNPPLASFVCSVKKNGTEIGTLTVSTAGAVTFATTGGVAVLAAAGDVISVVAPSTNDTGISNLAFTLVGVTNTTSVYLGARVKLANSTGDATGNRIVVWTTEDHDDGGFWASSSPDRFIVPAGVTKVRVQAGVMFANASTNTTGYAAILKNSSDAFSVDQTKIVSMMKATSAAFDSAAVNVDTGVISVVEGDYFTLTVNTGGDTAAGVDKNGSFFSIEAADGSALLSGEPDILQPTPLLVTPTYRFGFFFEYAPEADERLGIHICTDAFTFADDFSGSLGFVETPPAAPYIMLVKKNNSVQIGTVTVSTSGAVTFDSTTTATEIGVGDRISLIAPSAKDTVITGGSFTFKGTFQ